MARPEERKFLGFTISNDGSERRIAPKALDKFKERIREMTCRTRGLSLSQIIEELAPYLVGWRQLLRLLPNAPGAHKSGSVDPPKITLISLAAVGEWAQPLQRTAPSWRIAVQGSGRRRFTNGILADVRAPGGPSGPAQPPLRFNRSPPTLCSGTRLNLVEPPWYATRMPGGVGGAAPRCPPLCAVPRLGRPGAARRPRRILPVPRLRSRS